MPETVVIFVNGQLPNRAAAQKILPTGAFLIAADGGTRHCRALGCRPHLLIGDLDSTPAATMQRLQAEGVEIRRYPRDKDETDLELALQAALSLAPRRILIVGALGGRLDQTLANLSLLTMPSLSGLDIRLDDGVQEAFFIRASAEISGQPGDVLSLIPWGREAAGIRTQGLRWPLHDETLSPRHTRGISNEMTGHLARVTLHNGLLLCVHIRSAVSTSLV